MSKIDIQKIDHWLYNFFTDRIDEEIYNTGKELCYYCGEAGIDKIYSYIINCLKEAKLLSQDYKVICCYCKILQKFGLIELSKNLTGFFYHRYIDVLSVNFGFNKNTINEECLTINVHDYSKWEEKF